MPVTGPTHGQEIILRGLGEKPEEFRDKSQEYIVDFIRRQRPTLWSGDPKARNETLTKQRKEEIRKKGLGVGVRVDALRGDGVKIVVDRPIREIADDGCVYLEGIKNPFFPQKIVPIGKKPASPA